MSALKLWEEACCWGQSVQLGICLFIYLFILGGGTTYLPNLFFKDIIYTKKKAHNGKHQG
jgi:hypothetical protein